MNGPTPEQLARLQAKAEWTWERTLLIHRSTPDTRVASSLSLVEVLVCLYYGGLMRFDPRQPLWEGRDRCIISKGHGSIAMYAILADTGFFGMEELDRVGRRGSILGSIPDPIIPGYETVNGSLGHGLGVGCGMALGLKHKASPNKVFVIMGDGELHEGAVWEAIMFAGHHRLGNLILIIDNNGRCMLNFSKQVLDLEPLRAKFSAFGWKVAETDGHDIPAVFQQMQTFRENDSGRPCVLIANTIKGHGVPSMEKDPLCHVKSLNPAEVDELLRARRLKQA